MSMNYGTRVPSCKAMKRRISANQLVHTCSIFSKSVVVSACQHLEELISPHSSSQLQKLVVHISMMSYLVRTFCQPSVPWHSLDMHLPLWLWPSNSQLLNPDHCKVWACCKDESTVPGSKVSTTLSSVLLKNGIASTT